VVATGGEVARLPVPFRASLVLDISSDGSHLLVLAAREPVGTGDEAGDLWAVPVVGSAPRRVGDVRATGAAWSRDRTRIAYTLGNALHVCAADGSDARRIWTAPEELGAPAWSPDGRRLRVTVGRGLSVARSLFEVGADGGEPHPLLPGLGRPACCGRWTPDGRHFVFQARGERTVDLWALPERAGWRRAGREPVRLTQGPLDFFDPVASPDGRRLFAVGVKPAGELVRYDAAGGQFVPYLSGLSAHELDFSRDGRWVAYVGFPEGSLWRSRVDGSERLQLTYPPQQAAQPRWSPDGSRIVFDGRVPGQPWRISIIPAAGGGARTLVAGARNQADATWSPDGKTLAFGYSVMEQGREGPIGIEWLDLATGRVTPVPGSEGLFSPRWSPDGRHLAALSADSLRLLVLEVGSGRWRELAASREWLTYPSWDASGLHLLVSEGLDRVRLGISDGRRDVVASLAGLRQPGGAWGEWTGHAPDGSLLSLRDVGIQELFALEWTN
jgi:Tol biopolymer transport system component